MNKTTIDLLLIEDNRADVVLLEVTLARDPHIQYGITAVEHLSAGLQKIKETHFDIVLLDLGLPDSQGLDTFQQVYAVDANLPVVVLSGLIDEDLALQAVHLGAQDYVVKGTTGWDSLSRSIRYAVERKRAQQALLTSEARYRSLFENSPVPIWEEDFSQVKNYLSTLQNNGVTDIDAYFTEHETALLECIQLMQVKDVNQAAVHMYKVNDKSELLGSLHKTLPPESLISFRNELAAIARGETSFSSETVLQTLDDELRNISVSWITPPGSEHTYEKVLISLVDITEHKQAEARLRQSEEQYRYLFDDNPLPMWAFDQETLAFLAVNDAAIEKYGYSRAEFLSMTIADIRPPEDLERFRQDHRYPSSRLYHSDKWRHKLKNGQIINVEITSHKLKLNNREVRLVVAQDITEHKLTEQKYQQIFENSLEGIFQSTPEGRFISLNPAMAHIYGYDSPQEMMDFIGNDISRVIYLDPKDRDQFTSGLQQADVIEHFEMKNRRKDGSVIWTSTSARAVRDIEGKILYYEGFLQDITQRKHAEEELQASETRYRLATQATRDVIWEWSRATNQIMWSENAQLVFGYSIEEVGPSAKWWDEHLHPEDRDRVISALNLLLTSMEGVLSWTDEYRFQLKNGSYAYINDHAYIERDIDGKVMRMIGAMSDITERKQAEEAIRNSEQRFRALIENGLDYISLLDGEGNLLWESPSSRNMLGFNFNEYVGRSIFELMHPEDFEWTSQQFAQLAQQPGQRITGIFRLQHSDGSWRWVEAIASNFLADPSVNAIVINYRDITERRQAELELEQRHADLGMVNAMNAALIRGESLHTVIDILADGLMNNFACQGTNVYLWDAETQALALQHYLLKPEVQHHIEETIGSTIPLIHMSLKTDGWFQRSLHSQQGLLLNQPETIRDWLTEFWEAMAATLAANSAKPYNVSNVILGIQSAILVPLNSGDQVIGLLDLASARQLSETDLTRILNLSRQLTAAIQRQQADERVRRSEDFLNSVQNSLLAHIAILDHQGNIVQVNSAWRKFAEQNGYEHPQYGVGLNYLEICDSAAGANAEGAQEVAIAIRQVLAGTRRAARVEYPCHSPEEKRWFVLRVTRFVNGNQNRVVLAHENITYRKQAEEAIRRSQSILAQAETIAHLGAWEIEVSNQEDINSNPARWSDEVYRILGYEPGEVEATNELFVERVHPQDREKISAAMHQAIALNKPYAVEHRIIQPNGTERIVEEHANLIRDQYGRLVQILGAVQDITEHKQIEASLKRTSEQLRVLFEASPEAIMLIDPHGNWPIVDCNEAACLMNGYRRDELIGQSIDILTLASGEETGRLDYLESIKATGVLRFDDSHRHKNGTVFPISTSTSIIQFGDQERVLGIDRDITDRKQAEQALQESREQYRNLVNQLPVIVYTDELVEGIGVTQFISPQIESITGFSIEEWLSGGFEGWKQQIHSEDRERIIEQYLQSLSKGEPFEAEYRLQTKTGQWIWMHDQFKVVLNTQNQPISSHGIMYDITERKEAEQAIQESEERYRTLVDQLPVIVYVDTLIDTVGVTQYVSPQIENIFGFTPEEWLAGGFELWMAQIHPEDRDRVLNEYQRCMETAKSFECEYRLRNKTGQLLWLHDQSKMVFNSHNQPVAAHGIVYDITAQKSYEEDRQRRVTELEALYENGLAISKLLDPKSISDKVVEVLAQKLHWHHAAIRFLHEETNQLELVSLQHPGLSEGQLREQIERLNNLISDPNKGLTGWAVKQHVPLRQGDLPSDPRYIETYPGMRSGLYVPILAGDHVLGAISVESELPNAFTEQDERLLLTLANQAAVAIENAQLYLIVQKELDERQQAERRLRESEANYRLLFELSPEGIITHDGRQITFVNAAAAKLIGASNSQEIIGRSVLHFLHPDSHQPAIERIQKQMRGEHIEPVEEKFVRLDGSIVDVEVNAAPIRTQGQPAFLVTLRDITERKRAEEALRQSEEKYRFLAEDLERRVLERTAEVQDLYNNAPCGYHSLDEQGNIVLINETELKWLGYSREEILHRPFAEFLTNESRNIFIKSFPAFIKDGEIRDLEFDLIRKDGSTLPVLINATAIYDHQTGKYLTSRSTLFDNTDRKYALEALRLANNEMKRALRTKDEFLANMSHELRTPLNAILGLSESLLEQTAGNLNEKQHRYLTTINESGTHLLELINDILDLAKVEAGQIKLDPGKVDINNLCQSSLRMVKQLAQKKSQKVEVNIQDNIGFIWADERRIKQMLVNLLSNAVKFTPAGGQLGLNALIDFKESKLLLTVWDTGIGIRDEDLPRLFKPFVQLDSSLSRETSGTGLGLALVAQMARLHGGSISVSSVPGQGSRFTIVLPWDPALTAETLEKMKITGRFPVIKSLPGKPKTILLVEDTDSVVMLIRDYLELSGYKVELARDGITGVSKAIASQPDLILMDVQMPGMDGFEATRRIRREPTLRQTPVIALTALAMANDRERCLEVGMNDYISKPVNLRQLVKIIQSYVSNSGIGDAA